MNEADEGLLKIRPTKKLTTTLLVAVPVVWFGIPLLIYFLPLDDAAAWAQRGQFGDVFGSVNALFSGLAFTVLTIALLLQGQELALQREELALTRATLGKAAAAQDESQRALNKTLHAQAFKAAVEILENERLSTARRPKESSQRTSMFIEGQSNRQRRIPAA